MTVSLVLAFGLAVIVVIALVKTAQVVPQREQFVIERLGKFSRTLDAGFHVLIPFVDRIAYKHTLKEQAFDVPAQSCITKDNIAVKIDGIMYLQVIDARSASYGIEHYLFATSQLAQTTLRSLIGKIELDRTFEERDAINAQVVEAVDKAAEPWGVKVLRYEIKDIVPPDSVRDALEKQMRAERERRAVVAESEGQRQAKINVSEGQKQETINLSEARQAAADQRSAGPRAADPADRQRDGRGAPQRRRRDRERGRPRRGELAGRRAVDRRMGQARADQQHDDRAGAARRHRGAGRHRDDDDGSDRRRARGVCAPRMSARGRVSAALSALRRRSCAAARRLRRADRAGRDGIARCRSPRTR